MTVIDAPSATRRDGSLNDVRAIIPDECYRRSNWKASVALISAAVLYAAPLVGLVLTSGIIVTIVLWVLAGLGVAGLFVLGHDASHGALLDSRRLNRVVAQLCLAPSAHAEAAWDLGHNRIHHGYTTREGFDFVWHPLTAEQYRELGRFARLRHRLEWSFAGAGIYYMRTVWWEKMWRFKAGGARRNAIVRDKVTMGTVGGVVLAATALVGLLLGGWTAALWWPLKLWVVPFLVFVHIIGWTVYVHHVSPEIRWWSRRDWSQYKGPDGEHHRAAHPATGEPVVVPQHLRAHPASRRRAHPVPPSASRRGSHRSALSRHGALGPDLVPRVLPRHSALQAVRLRAWLLGAVRGRTSLSRSG
jgi:omega-6 fatty acid desaturase (delta-12 desaturase)